MRIVSNAQRPEHHSYVHDATKERPWNVKITESYASVISTIREQDIDLLLLFLDSANYHFVEHCRFVLRHKPIIVIIDQGDLIRLTSEAHMSQCLKSGATVVMTKYPEEYLLRAQIEALVALSPSITYSSKNIEWDKRSGALLIRGKEARLTKKQRAILELLFDNAGNTVSRERIVCSAWTERPVDNGTLNRSMSRLRNVLTANKVEERIKTVHGIGYRLEVGKEHHTSPNPVSITSFPSSGLTIGTAA
jgi:DNA-binding response OmpR family regulator